MTETKLQRRDLSNPYTVYMAVVGPLGAVHYWHVIPTGESDGEMPCGGIEAHWKNPPSWGDADKPSHEECSILGGVPCWHDGSSLQAEKLYTPLWLRCKEQGDFEPMWQQLESEYRERIEE